MIFERKLFKNLLIGGGIKHCFVTTVTCYFLTLYGVAIFIASACKKLPSFTPPFFWKFVELHLRLKRWWGIGILVYLFERLKTSNNYKFRYVVSWSQICSSHDLISVLLRSSALPNSSLIFTTCFFTCSRLTRK